jgi:ribosomal protein L37E
MPGATTSPMPSTGMSAEGDTIFCGECGTKNVRSAKFCSQCGHAIGAAVG